MTSTPPGTSSRHAVSARARTASRPSGPPYSAIAGSWSRTSGSIGTASSGTYGGFDTTTDTVPSSSGQRVGEVALDESHRPAVGVDVPPGPGQRLGRPLDGVHHGVRHLGVHRDRDRTAAGAQVDGDRLGHRGRPQRVDAELHDALGLRTGHEHAGSDGQGQRAEVRLPVMCCSGSRVARRATACRKRSTCSAAIAAAGHRTGLHGAARGVGRPREQQLGVDPGRRDADATSAAVACSRRRSAAYVRGVSDGDPGLQAG